MSEADLFRQYAKDAMHGASKASSGNGRRLADLASTWVQTALMSERVLDQALFRRRAPLLKPDR